VDRTNGKANGASGNGIAQHHAELAPPPQAIQDLAEACVRFVERAVGVKLDYEPETLPLLDHYIEQGRKAARERPETVPLIAQAAGAYIGEVVRRRHKGWWRTEDKGDPSAWRVELENVYLVLRPVELVMRALRRPDPPPPPPSVAEPADDDEDSDERDAEADDGALAQERGEEASGDGSVSDPEEDVGPAFFEFDEADRDTIAARLAQLPPVSIEEFYASSTHVEVVDIVVEELRSRRIEAGVEPDAHLEPEDYDD
jgi:hypothetical protein